MPLVVAGTVVEIGEKMSYWQPPRYALALSLAILTPLVLAAESGRPALSARVQYASLFGGPGDDSASHVRVDRVGNLYIVGATTSQTLPGAANTFQPTRPAGIPGTSDVFVAKFDQTGTRLLWATFLGGDQSDEAIGVTVDGSGNVCITGETRSDTFPTTTGAYQRSSTPNRISGFISIISADGRALLASTYIPRIRATVAQFAANGDVVVAADGDVDLSAVTTRPGQSTTPTSTLQSLALYRFPRDLSRPSYVAFLAGGGFSGGSRVSSMTLLPDGSTLLAGDSASPSLPVPASAIQALYSNAGLTNSIGAGALDNGFFLQVSADGSRILSGSYFGPRLSGTRFGSLFVASDGRLLLVGTTNAESLPVTANAAKRSADRGFVLRVAANRQSFDYLSFLTQTQSRAPAAEADSMILHSIGEQQYQRTDLLTGEITTTSTRMFASSLALDGRNSVWFVGGADPGRGASIVSPDAYQTTEQGRTEAYFGRIEVSASGVAAVTSAAAPDAGLACGQLVSLFGTDLGPNGGEAAAAAGGRFPTRLAGTRVLVGPTATPAPLFFVGSNQVNAAIPFSLCGQSTADLILERNGSQISTTRLTLQPTAPALFTAAGGRGQAAALNQDGTVNGPSNPARRGQVVTLFFTGAGPMTGPVIDGGLAQDAGVRVAEPVTAIIGSFDTGEVLYAGAAPGLVFGVGQLNVQISTSAPVGPATSIRIRVGAALSPPGATLAIQ